MQRQKLKVRGNAGIKWAEKPLGGNLMTSVHYCKATVDENLQSSEHIHRSAVIFE